MEQIKKEKPKKEPKKEKQKKEPKKKEKIGLTYTEKKCVLSFK